MSLHVSILELANISLIQVGEIIRTIAIKDSIQEVSFVIAAIWPSVPPMAILLAVLESTSVPGCIRLPGFRAVAMLAVVKPVTLIAVPLEIGEDTTPIGLV